MAGILSSMVAGGVHRGAEAWETGLIDKRKAAAQKARDANLERIQRLRDKSSQEFRTSERLSGEEFAEEQTEKKLTSAEKVAGARTSAASKKSGKTDEIKHKERWYKAFDAEMKNQTSDGMVPQTPEMEAAAESEANKRWGALPSEGGPASDGTPDPEDMFASDLKKTQNKIRKSLEGLDTVPSHQPSEPRGILASGRQQNIKYEEDPESGKMMKFVKTPGQYYPHPWEVDSSGKPRMTPYKMQGDRDTFSVMAEDESGNRVRYNAPRGELRL